MSPVQLQPPCCISTEGLLHSFCLEWDLPPHLARPPVQAHSHCIPTLPRFTPPVTSYRTSTHTGLLMPALDMPFARRLYSCLVTSSSLLLNHFHLSLVPRVSLGLIYHITPTAFCSGLRIHSVSSYLRQWYFLIELQSSLAILGGGSINGDPPPKGLQSAWLLHPQELSSREHL